LLRSASEIQTVEIKVISLDKQTHQQFEFSKLIRAIKIFQIKKEMKLADKSLEKFLM
jgi:hypothetical protein